MKESFTTTVPTNQTSNSVTTTQSQEWRMEISDITSMTTENETISLIN